MSEWTEPQLERIGGAEEVEVATADPDGALRPFIVIWVVRVDNALYVRSFHGPLGEWYRRARRSKRGRVRAGGLQHDVTFRDAQPDDEHAISNAYRTKYAFSPHMESMVSPEVGSATLQLVAV